MPTLFLSLSSQHHDTFILFGTLSIKLSQVRSTFGLIQGYPNCLLSKNCRFMIKDVPFFTCKCVSDWLVNMK